MSEAAAGGMPNRCGVSHHRRMLLPTLVAGTRICSVLTSVDRPKLYLDPQQLPGPFSGKHAPRSDWVSNLDPAISDIRKLTGSNQILHDHVTQSITTSYDYRPHARDQANPS